MICHVTNDRGERCAAQVSADAPLPICDVHAAEVTTWFSKRDHFTSLRERLLRDQATPQADESRQRGIPRSSVVYYVQIGEFIKIGTSIDIRQRLQAYPPDAQLLATEPGSFPEEAQRLEQFNRYLAHGREWFVQGLTLMAHIETLVAKSA